MKKILLTLFAAIVCAASMTAQVNQPLTFEAMVAGATVTYSIASGTAPTIEYKFNDGAWTTYSTAITLPNIGDKVSFRGNNATYYVSYYSSKFQCSADCYIYGNIMSLVSATGYASATTLTQEYAFASMFINNTHIKNHSTKALVLPATTLAKDCYYQMFYGCTGITSVPALPATTLANSCYSNMFYGCTGLTSIPENLLPATTLANYCYQNMFYGCTGLTNIPENLLPATTLANNCCQNMFNGCTGLTTIPENLLPATTLANYCYAGMFMDCTGLTSIPGNLLPATTLAEYCYYFLFRGCNGLTTVPENLLPATTLANKCYWGMLERCTGLTTVPENLLPATTLANACYRGLFYMCPSLTTVPEKLLPATTLADECYYEMFRGCTSLTTAPDLPATTLTRQCYYQMFYDCTSLTIAPELPATTLTRQCYYGMFQNCSNLYSLTCYATTNPEKQPTENWLNGVASGGTFYAPSNGYFNSRSRSVSAIPSGWNIGTVWFSMTETPLMFEAKEAGAQVSFTRRYSYGGTLPTIQYSTNGSTWSDYSSTITLARKGDRVYFRGNNATYQLSGGSNNAKFTCSKDCYIYGNIMSLVNATGYATATTLTATGTFYYLFENNTHIKSHSSKTLVLPATTLTAGCYNSMFYGCTGLTRAPALPATTLAETCYYQMFYGCTGLTSAPALSATSLTDRCYQSMFQGCTGLTSAPALPATTLTDYCYQSMFYGCTGLTSAPALPATTLTDHCYQYMFRGCTSLTSAPSLPATTLGGYCYDGMFQSCSSLTSAPALPATTMTDYCYNYMFYGCSSLTSAPAVLPATTLASSCYRCMFEGCSSLTSAPELPATTLTTWCYLYMFSGCTSLTSVPQLPATTLGSNCYYCMFQNCTSLNSIPENLLPATTLANSCYGAMFDGCTGLTSIPENLLPATTLTQYCYSSMFQGCTGITSIPENLLPATTLANYCYQNMFKGCTGLTSIPEDLLPATTLTDYCYKGMFQGCIGLTSIPENLLPATTLVNSCYDQMFRGCTNLSSVTCWATSRENTNATTNWLNSVAENGTFHAPKNSVFASDEPSANSIPEGWTFIPFQASITSTPTAIDGLVYNGNEQTLIHAGEASNGTMNYSLDGITWSEDIPTATSADDYTVYYMAVGDDTYADNLGSSIAVSITPAPLTITADDKEVVYNEATPTYTATYSGFVNSETESVLTGSLALACSYSAGDALGDYTITPSGLSSNNYAITWETGTLSVISPSSIVLPDNEDKTALLTALNGQTLDITIGRTIVAGPYNTFCLPFSLSESDIATNPIAGAILKDYNGADVSGTGAERDLNIYLSDLTEIEAGKPFLIKTETNIVNPVFSNVTISYTSAMGSNVEREHVDFQGILAPYDLAAYSNSSPDYLGIGMDGRLYWADASLSSAPMRGFRAFFHVKDAGVANSPVRRGMHAQFVENSPKTPTGVEGVQPSEISIQKILRDGHVIIIRNGVSYNVNGQIVK